jgi:hypothetical protein
MNVTTKTNPTVATAAFNKASLLTLISKYGSIVKKFLARDVKLLRMLKGMNATIQPALFRAKVSEFILQNAANLPKTKGPFNKIDTTTKQYQAFEKLLNQKFGLEGNALLKEYGIFSLTTSSVSTRTLLEKYVIAGDKGFRMQMATDIQKSKAFDNTPEFQVQNALKHLGPDALKWLNDFFRGIGLATKPAKTGVSIA